MTMCPRCFTQTSVDGDHDGALFVVMVLRVILFGGLTLVIGTLLLPPLIPVFLAFAVSLMQIFRVLSVKANGMTTCHACRTTFATR